MKSFLLLSIVLAALAIPAVTARHPNPRRGVWRMLLLVFLFNAAYLLYVTFVHPVLFPPEW